MKTPVEAKLVAHQCKVWLTIRFVIRNEIVVENGLP